MSPRILVIAASVALLIAAAAGFGVYRYQQETEDRPNQPPTPAKVEFGPAEPPPTFTRPVAIEAVAPPPLTEKPEPASDIAKAGLTVIVEDEKQAPVAGLGVRLVGGSLNKTQQTDPQGIARFVDIAPEKYQIHVLPEGTVELRSLRRIVVPPGKTREMHVKLQSFDAAISGRVLGPAGNPVAGVDVRALPFPAGASQVALVPMKTHPPAKSDADGRFEITGLASGEYTITTSPQEGFPVARSHVTAPANDVKLFLKESINLIVKGVVADVNRDGVEGAKISVQGQIGSIETDAEGNYRLEIEFVDTANARLLVVAQRDGYAPGRELASLEEIGESGEIEVPFQLASVDELAVVSGRLVDQNGEPVGGERVFLRSRKLNSLYSGSSDSNGEFVVEDVMVAKDYRLWVYPRQTFRDYVDDGVTIESDENSFEIQLEPFEVGSLGMLLVNADGDPLPGLTIRVRNTKALSRMMTLTSDKDGRVNIAEVPVGPLVVDNRTFPRLNAVGVAAVADKNVRVEIPLGIGDRSISGQVMVGENEPLSGARAVVTWRGTRGAVQSRVFQETVTDAEGRFSVGGFGSGAIAVGVNAEGYRSQRVPVSEEGGDQELVITLEPLK